MKVKILGLVALIALSLLAGRVGWAEQREALLLSGPRTPITEKAIPVAACNLGIIASCQGNSQTSCTSECHIIAICAPCRDRVYKECLKSNGCE